MSDIPIEPGALPSGRRATPYDTDRMPPGVPFIIGNEAAERFSYYGMTAILAVFLSKYLLNSEGLPAPMSEPEAKKVSHYFMMAVYFFPIFGAILSDVVLGKYRTILYVSLLYCVGHGAMALVDMPKETGVDPRLMLFAGLALISIGAGGIKPCVSANVGDQFGSRNKHLIQKVFTWFYFSINFGSAFSTLLTPLFLNEEKFYNTFGKFGHALGRIGIYPGPALAFGVPGVLMAIATFVFWLGRNKYVHIPPGGTSFLKELTGPEGRSAARNLIPMFLLISIFFALFDQSHTSWVLQAEKMDRKLFAGTRFEVDPDASQFQAVNPMLVLAFIPLFAYVIYPVMGKFFTLTPLRKIAIGMFVTVPSFALIAMAQEFIDNKETPHVSWQIWAYLILTAAEIMVSITALEFSYTQAPRKMKSFVMGMYLLFSIALGNFFAAQVNGYIEAAVTTSSVTAAASSSEFTAEGLVGNRRIGAGQPVRILDDQGEVAQTGTVESFTPATGRLRLAAPLDAAPAAGTKFAVGKPVLEGADYFWFFTAAMLTMAVVFAIYAQFYRGQTYIQGEDEGAAA